MERAPHIVRNFASLAKTKLRRDALAILEAGIRAAMPDVATRALCALDKGRLRIGPHAYGLHGRRRVFVIGIGKAAGPACAALEGILGRRIAGGVVIDTKRHAFRRLRSMVGDHPFPTARNVRATDALMRIVRGAGKEDLVIAVVSGGGSSLLCAPDGVSLSELVAITKGLMRSGVPIARMNAVRKRFSAAQGGRLAQSTSATVAGLIYSDVPGGDLSSVASGPTVRDASTRREAMAALRASGLGRFAKALKETPKDPAPFRRTRNVLVLDNGSALAAMRQAAQALGYRSRIVRDPIAGEARDVGRRLARAVRPGEAVLAGGETTVKVTGRGNGGRNQEAVLGALGAIGDALVISCASDGIDNGPAAGAIADRVTAEMAAAAKIDAVRALVRNDAYPFFRRIRQHLVTGKTGANVADLFVALRPKTGRDPKTR